MATMTTAIVRAASVVTAGMLTFAVFVVVMIAFDLGVEVQFVCKHGADSPEDSGYCQLPSIPRDKCTI